MDRQLYPKILILENQMIIAADVCLQCSKLGYQVIGINSRVEDALKTIQVNRPDIVLMNIGMKEKMNGLMSDRIILDSFQVPVVLMSSYTDKTTFNQIIEVKPYAFISKPFEKNDLQKGIETALSRMEAEGLMRWTI